MSHEALLIQLGYNPNESTLAQLGRIVANTAGFEHIQKHLITLHDTLKVHHAFVALSNNKDYFKIKMGEQNKQKGEEVEEIILKWSEKYKITLEQVPHKSTYYVLGYKS